MVVMSKQQMANLLQERRKAMANTRFKPENYGEIKHVLGVRFAPDLNLVMSKQRAHVASAYLKRLHRDVERSKGGFYDQLHALPMQIQRMTIHTEDQRSFKSVLVPKLKLSPLMFSPGSEQMSSKSSSPSTASLPTVVPNKSFSPHTNTHVHVLYKQGPGSITPKKGASSVVSSITSVATSSRNDKPSTCLKPASGVGTSTSREEVGTRSSEDTGSDSVSSVEESPEPYSFLKTMSNQTPRPHIKKSLFVNLMPHNISHHPDNDQHLKPSKPSANRFFITKTRHDLPPKPAAVLTGGKISPSTALYKFVLPSKMVPTSNSLPPERPKRVVIGIKNRYPLPSIPAKTGVDSPLLAIIPTQPPNIVRAAA